MKEPAICMRSRLSQRDCYYGGGLVNGARNVTLMADCANRLMAREYGNIGRCRNKPQTHNRFSISAENNSLLKPFSA